MDFCQIFDCVKKMRKSTRNRIAFHRQTKYSISIENKQKECSIGEEIKMAAEKGRVTIPTDLDVIRETLDIMGEWGADAIREMIANVKRD